MPAHETWLYNFRISSFVDGTQWQPAKWSNICSVHFFGREISANPACSLMRQPSFHHRTATYFYKLNRQYRATLVTGFSSVLNTVLHFPNKLRSHALTEACTDPLHLGAHVAFHAGYQF